MKHCELAILCCVGDSSHTRSVYENDLYSLTVQSIREINTKPNSSYCDHSERTPSLCSSKKCKRKLGRYSPEWSRKSSKSSLKRQNTFLYPLLMRPLRKETNAPSSSPAVRRFSNAPVMSEDRPSVITPGEAEWQSVSPHAPCECDFTHHTVNLYLQTSGVK